MRQLLLNRRPCLVGGLYTVQELVGRGVRVATVCVLGEQRWLSSFVVVQKKSAGAMLKSEGWRCSAAGWSARSDGVEFCM